MKDRRENRKRWVQRGQYAVAVEVEVIYPADDPSEPCLEPATVRWLDEVAQRAGSATSSSCAAWEGFSKRFRLDEKAG